MNHPCSAHCKIDRKTGELFLFGCPNNEPTCHYTLINKDKKKINYVPIPLATPRMLHDFLITENYVVIPDTPLEINPRKTAMEKMFIGGFNPKGVCRYGVMKKYC